MPAPTAEVWGQYPLFWIFLFALVLIGGGLFGFARWAWGEYKKERDVDRKWREDQNAARELAVKEQNQSWQTTVNLLDSRREKQDQSRDETLKAIAESTVKMLEKLDRHDERAARIEQNTTPRKRT